uniref:Uncharacterized protein n=1 Tax=Picea glauca TaxID=3330 RepID=A0A124GME3_PICGL|nr:hypothetical protein ABT39_MTgene3441 [Picea glauca]
MGEVVTKAKLQMGKFLEILSPTTNQPNKHGFFFFHWLFINDLLLSNHLKRHPACLVPLGKKLHELLEPALKKGPLTTPGQQGGN